MLKSSRNAAAPLAVVLVLTAAILCLFAQLSELSAPLLPKSASAYPWKALATSDSVAGGSSVIAIKESDSAFGFEFKLSSESSLAWVTFSLEFDDFNDPKSNLDWSRYASLNLMMACEPNNLLAFSLFTWDEQVSRAGDFPSLRNPAVFFECHEDPKSVKIDLRDLVVPEWWLKERNLPLSDTGYRLDKVMGLAFHNAYQSPRGVPSRVTIRSATLEGRDWRYLFFAGVLLSIIWAGFLVWGTRQYTRLRIERIVEETRTNQPFIPYQKLPAVTRQDEAKNAVLTYLATEYANPELGIEMVATALGLSRTKINDILKDERGLTFSAYLNKLRLAEAARLLQEKEASVSEVSYAVGYNNTSYFIAVFKKEYGCTPKAYKKHMADNPGP